MARVRTKAASSSWERDVSRSSEYVCGHGERGFTIVELLVSLVIVAILAALAIINASNAIEKSRVTSTIAQIRNLEIEIGKIEIDEGTPPPNLAAIGRGHLRDPWGAPYQYLSFATMGNGIPGKARKDKKLKPLNSTYDLYSKGPDGKSKSPLTAKSSRDDIVRAADGAFIGRASDF